MDKDRNHTLKVVKVLFVVLFVLYSLWISIVFFSDQLIYAAQKPFWGDEIFGLNSSIRKVTYGQLFINGASHQSSPAPLDYVFCKILDELRPVVGSFGLREEVYYRLWANLITSFSALFVVIMFVSKVIRKQQPFYISLLQSLLLSFVPITFFFSRHVYYYAAEIRPYAAWNAFWFLALAMSLLDNKKNLLLILSLTLLAFTSTASIYQIGVMLLATLIMDKFENVPLKSSIKKSLRIFTMPVAVSLYYCLRASQWNEKISWEEWDQFMDIWIHYSSIVAFMSLCIVLCLLKKENKKYMIAPLSFLLLYLFGPVTFWITKWKGYFFSYRQYIYYDLANAVFSLTVIQCLPAYFKDKSNKLSIGIMCVVVLMTGVSIAFRPKSLKKLNNAMYNTYHLWNY